MRNRLIALILAIVPFLSVIDSWLNVAYAKNISAEHGRFRLHKFMQPIGEETYEISRNNDSLVLTSNFEFSDRGTKVPLSTQFQAKADLTPLYFKTKGEKARSSSIDLAITINAHNATITNGALVRNEALPNRYFTIAGYAPVAMQMVLMRYWLAHGKPAKLHTVPLGQLSISECGITRIKLDGSQRTLHCYKIDGLIWGREWLWLDHEKNLVGLISIDAELDHFEAVREGYESALGKFVTLAATDGMTQLAEFAKTISTSSSATFAISGATLIDGTGQAPIPNANILIGGDRILAAGPSGSVTIPKGTHIIDASGKWLMPGLWDMHAHFQQVEWGPLYLAAGITTARDCGNEFEFITAVRDAIDAGRGLGPRLLLAGLVDGDSAESLGTTRINSIGDIANVIDRYKEAGFLQIKIYGSIKPELVSPIANAAHKAGLTVTGHIPTGMSMTQGIEAGMDQINHLGFVLEEIAPRKKFDKLSPAEAATAMQALSFTSPEARKIIGDLANRHIVIDPTIALIEKNARPQNIAYVTLEPGITKLPAALAEALSNTGIADERADYISARFEKRIELIGALHRANVPIVAGTDQTIPGHSLHREIELYVKAGFTPMEAIQAATIVPARTMRLEKENGTIEAGKAADMLLLDADPLAAISNTRNIYRIITRGRVYDPAPLWRAAGFQP